MPAGYSGTPLVRRLGLRPGMACAVLNPPDGYWDLLEELPDGMIWVSWPKTASGVETDLTGDVVRQIGRSAGLVDIKVCAVDETWSGLKFVIRRKDPRKGPVPDLRPGSPPPRPLPLGDRSHVVDFVRIRE